jgi:hypothetical protein
MKTITRFQAQKMLEALGGMALGHLTTEDLERVIDNFDILKAEVDKLDKMKTELNKRIYQDIEQERLHKFFEAIQKNDAENLNKEYADLLPLRVKEVDVTISLYNKLIDVDLKEIDSKDFRKAVIKAQPDTKQGAFTVLAPIFKAEEVKEDKEDYSELEELLK